MSQANMADVTYTPLTSMHDVYYFIPLDTSTC